MVETLGEFSVPVNVYPDGVITPAASSVRFHLIIMESLVVDTT